MNAKPAARGDKPRSFTSLRLDDMDRLRRVKRDVEKQLGVQMSFGQVIAYLCAQWEKK